jgi:YVTN family beta-propeller protein
MGMSSDNRVPQIGKPDGASVTGVARIAVLLALLASAGCGGSTSANGGGGTSATIRGTIAVGTGPSAIAVDSTTNKIYVTDFGTIPTGIPCSMSGADVEAIDGATQAKTSVGFSRLNQVNAIHAALNPVSHKLYVQIIAYWNGINGDPCVPFSPGMEVFDTTSLQPPNGHIFVAAEAGIDVNSVTDTIYVTYPGVAGAVFVDDSNMQWLATIPVGSVPIGVAVNATSNKIYVANSRSNNISVIDGASNTVVATVADPNAIAPFAVAVNATTNTIYVANSQSNNLTVIDGGTNAVIATIPVGTSPSAVAVDSHTNFIYVANFGNSQGGNRGNITVIDGAKHTTTTLTDPKAMNPIAVAANSVTNKAYVANWASNNVTVIDGAHD